MSEVKKPDISVRFDVDDIRKIFKGDGIEGTSIYYDVWLETKMIIKRYVQDFICTQARDRYWDELLDYLDIPDNCNGLKLPSIK